MVSSPSFPYDVREMRSESRPHALNASRASINFLSAAEGEHFLRAFQTLISHPDAVRTVARNRDGVIAIISLRHRGDEIRVTAARSRRVPSIDFLTAAGRALPPRPFQTLVSHVDVVRIYAVALNRDGVIAIFSLRRRRDEIRVTAARSQRAPEYRLPLRGGASTASAPSRHWFRT